MINLDEYSTYDGLGLAELVARKEVTAQELIATALAAIEKVNLVINAVCRTLPDEIAAATAAPPQVGPFAGVPFLTKEMSPQAKGVRCDGGSRLGEGMVGAVDTELMTRFRRAGFVHVGTTQSPELGYSPTTENKLFGPVRNPWDTSRSAGGSSGGAAAAVAAGIVPIAHGGDGGGSIRIPASCCGLVGLKPSRDRIPTGPGASDPLCGLSVNFALARSVRDVAALLDAVAGADPGAPGIAPAPLHSFQTLATLPPSRLRVAWTAHPASGAPADPDCTAAVEATALLLQELGHEVVEDAPRFDWDDFLENVHVIWTVFTARFADRLAAATGRKPGADTLEAASLACYEAGRRYSAVDLVSAMDHGGAVSRTVGTFFQDYDVTLSPTIGRPPALLGEIDQDRAGIDALEWTREVFGYCPFTPLYNTTGQPAISLPLHQTADGLPIGVQFAARLGEEATLLQLARQIEIARPWSHRRPAT
ncbi:MAG: amidase [Janthinobacterium lividum]